MSSSTRPQRRRAEDRPAAGKAVQVLVLEGDAPFAQIIGRHLERIPWAQCRLRFVATLAAALRELKARSFDVILADLHLADSDGLETLDALHRTGNGIIVVLTGGADKGLREASLRRGAYHFLNRDQVDRQGLQDVLRLALAQASTSQSLKIANDAATEEEGHLRATMLKNASAILKVRKKNDHAQKASAEQLRKSESRFHALTNLSADWYWEQDSDLRFVARAGGKEERAAMRPLDDIGKRRWELDLFGVSDAQWSAHKALLAARLPFSNFRCQRKLADGVHFLSISGEPIFDDQGRFSGYQGIGKDISEDVRRDEELLRFRLAMDESADIFAIVDRSTMKYADVNSTSCTLLGYSREELLAMGPQDVVVGSRADLEQAYDALIAAPSASGSKSVSLAHFRCKDGTLLPFESTRHVLRLGERRFIVAICRDIRARLASEQALRQSEDSLKRFRAALNGSADMMFLVDMKDHTLLDFNDTACTVLGYERSELILLDSAVLMGMSATEVEAGYSALLGTPRRMDSVVRTFRRRDGRTFEVEALRKVIDTPDGRIVVINARDLTERNLEVARQAQYVRYQEVIARFGESALGRRDSGELVNDALQSVLDALRVNAVAYLERGPGERELVLCGLLGVPGYEASEAAHYDIGDPVGAAFEQGEMVITDGLSSPLPFGWAEQLRCAAMVPIRTGQSVQGALCAFSRVEGVFGTQETKFLLTAGSVLSAGLRRIEGEGRLAFLAQFDSLTGLPNRDLLTDRLLLVIALARRNRKPVGVLFIDLDKFKEVNDSLGHAAGDEVLIKTAHTLQGLLREGDTVARISGDEFAVILGELAKPEDAALVAQKIIDRLTAPLQVAGQEIFVGASIGIAAFPADGDNPEALLGAADAAMYRAKQSGRNSFQFYTAEINERARAHAQLGAELHHALERSEFALAYQPKFDLATGQPCAAEALLRWKRPDGTPVSPAQFIPVLEESGLIVAVGEWVLQRACEDLNAWKAAGLRSIPVAVNLSARQFRQEGLDQRIRQIVEAAGVDPSLIELEITESQLMHDPEQAQRTVHSLSDAGFRVAIDDFGTGYSSLAYLTRFPVSALKIDRSFVANALEVPAHAAIVRAIIDMAHTLGFIVIAEGVETEAQAALLRALGCEQAQGYFLARPMPEAELRILISASPQPRRGARS